MNHIMETIAERLIQKVKQYSFLYAVSSTDYRNLRKRQEAWDEIGIELGIKGEKAKETWERLRRCYTNALCRRRSRIEQGNTTIVIWKYERQMSFVLPFLEQRIKVVQALSDNPDFVEENSMENEYTPEKSREYKTEELEDVFPEENFITNMEDVKPPSPDVPKRKSKKRSEAVENNDIDLPKRKKLKRKVRAQEEAHSTNGNLETTNQPTISSSLEQLDETDLFFLSMSRMTKKLSNVEQAKIKLTLSNTVLEAEVRHAEGIGYT